MLSIVSVPASGVIAQIPSRTADYRVVGLQFDVDASAAGTDQTAILTVKQGAAAIATIVSVPVTAGGAGTLYAAPGLANSFPASSDSGTYALPTGGLFVPAGCVCVLNGGVAPLANVVATIDG